MSLTGFYFGFADFSLALPLEETALLISKAVFGGIPFRLSDKQYSEEFPVLILQSDFLGMVVEFGGGPEHYTIEIGTRPSASVGGISEVADLSAMLKQQLAQVPNVVLKEVTS